MAGAQVGATFGVGGVADLMNGLDLPLAAYEGGEFSRGYLVGDQAGDARNGRSTQATACRATALSVALRMVAK